MTNERSIEKVLPRQPVGSCVAVSGSAHVRVVAGVDRTAPITVPVFQPIGEDAGQVERVIADMRLENESVTLVGMLGLGGEVGEVLVAFDIVDVRAVDAIGVG